MSKYLVEFTLHMAGSLELEAESREEAQEEVESLSISYLEDCHFAHEVEIESVTEVKG